MSAKHGKQPRKQNDRWRLPLLAILLIGEIACLWITFTTSRFTGTPQWVISTAFLLAAVVIPSCIMHTLAGPGKQDRARTSGREYLCSPDDSSPSRGSGKGAPTSHK